MISTSLHTSLPLVGFGSIYTISNSRAEERLLKSYRHSLENNLFIPARAQVVAILRRAEVPMLLLDVLDRIDGVDKEFCMDLLRNRRPADADVDRLFKIHDGLYGGIATECFNHGQHINVGDLSGKTKKGRRGGVSLKPSSRKSQVPSQTPPPCVAAGELEVI